MSSAPPLAPDAAARERPALDVAHVPALDGVRGLAIALVLGHHAVEGVPLADLPWVARISAAAISLGWVGVDLFFALSGFLITRILLESKGAPRYFASFYGRRALRIWPLYLATLAVLTVVALAFRGDPESTRFLAAWPWYWTHTLNLLLARAGDWVAASGTGHFWSLAVEEQFYLVWPLVIALLPLRAVAPTCAALAIGGAALRTALLMAGVSQVSVFVLPVTHVEPLALGGLIAASLPGPLVAPNGLAGAVERAAMRLGSTRRAWWIAGALATTAILLALTAAAHSPLAPLLNIGLPLVALGSAAVVAAAAVAEPHTAVGRGLGGPARVSRALRWLGVVSYGLYVLHYPIFHVADVLAARAGLDDSGPSMLAARALALAASLVAAWASWHLWEKRWLALKRYVPRASRAPSLQPLDRRAEVRPLAIEPTAAGR
jgi:peptidoglycan/LPS O-acetylase OafA/YrhL